MIEYRGFRNTDPPLLIDIWQKQNPFRCFSSVMNRKLLEQMVLSKPYFDAAGLTLAFDDGRPVGFAHAGFGPTSDLSEIDHSIGILSQLRITDSDSADRCCNGLLERAMAYMRDRGATVCYAGSLFPYAPFYTGLYGGSRIPGVPQEDIALRTRLAKFGFRAGEKIIVMQRNLAGFRPPVNRNLMSVRRQYQVSAIVDPLLPSWWESCTFGWSELTGFRVVRRNEQTIVGGVMLWEIQPLSVQWGKLTMGLVDLWIDEPRRRQGIATFLIGEALRHLLAQGVACVEVQFRETNEPGIAVARNMGFEPISEGTEMSKKIASEIETH